MVAKLRAIELEHGCKISIIHVSGERMKAQGADGLSRGNLLEGVMKHQDILAFVPLHLSAMKRKGGTKLVQWIRSWAECKKEKLYILNKEEWFIRGHDIVGYTPPNSSHIVEPIYQKGNFLWAPPPALAEVACEEIRRARNKRQLSTHIFVCPRLLTPQWRKHLHRAADILFEIPPSCDYWPVGNFEPLTLAIFFPFISHKPWQLRRTGALIELERHLSQMWKEGFITQGSVLRKLWVQTRKLDHMPKHLVSKMLQSMSEFGISCE